MERQQFTYFEVYKPERWTLVTMVRVLPIEIHPQVSIV